MVAKAQIEVRNGYYIVDKWDDILHYKHSVSFLDIEYSRISFSDRCEIKIEELEKSGKIKGFDLLRVEDTEDDELEARTRHYTWARSNSYIFVPKRD